MSRPLLQINKAKKLISKYIAKINKESSIYRSEPWGVKDQAHFLNQVVRISSTRPAIKILAIIKKIETMLGRITTKVWGPRIIDIDIIFYASDKISTSALKVPHPQLQHRMFTLIPLAELTNRIHPILHKTIKELITDCVDTGKVVKYK